MSKQPRSKSIRLKCRECSSGSPQEVENCEHTTCHLYPYRMKRAGLPEGKTAGERDKAIRHYCREWCCNDQFIEVKLCPSTNCPLWHRRGYKTEMEQRSHATECNEMT